MRKQENSDTITGETLREERRKVIGDNKKTGEHGKREKETEGKTEREKSWSG